MHISSLPSKYGIGTLGESAYKFIDFLEACGQKYWQILPITPTGYGNSPYQSYSSFAGNPYFIDLEILSDSGNLNISEAECIFWGDNPEFVDFDALYNNRFKLLWSAYIADKEEIYGKLNEFRKKNAYWIEDYAMFMVLKFKNQMKPFWEWDDLLKFRDEKALAKIFEQFKDELEFWVYIQYRFFEQWNALKTYANSKNIKIIGDIPIYVAEDSADAWAKSDILMLDENKRPICVAGCPPDYFSPKGQLWGNPLYDWDYLKQNSYEWWILRIKSMLELCDVVRIDHFRAFSAYYSIPFGDEDAVNGKWIAGPREDFFYTLKNILGENLPIIAEDLGTLDDDVRSLLGYTGFPGMKVLQFAFNPDGLSDYLPHKYDKNCVAYIGTHDNDTINGWLSSTDRDTVSFAFKYLNIKEGQDFNWEFIKSLLATVADVTIITMQDLLGLDSYSRMNTPSTSERNWQWRLRDINLLNNNLSEKLKAVTQLYGR